MNQGRLRAFCVGLCLFLSAAHAWGQAVTPEDEYKKLVRVDQDIHPLGEHPFGEQVDLVDGALSFDETDVSAQGNGPLLQFSRSFQIQGKDYNPGRGDLAFGDWSLNLPRITTITANAPPVVGWVVGTSTDTNRCSDFGPPPTVPAPNGDSASADWEPQTWWRGYHLVVPGQGSQTLLARQPSNTHSPQMSGQTFSIVTKQDWMIRCLSSTANGEPGEGFLAIAPDGTKYWFDELVYRWAPTINRPLDSGPISEQSPSSKGNIWRSIASDQLLPKILGALTGASEAHAALNQDYLLRRQASMLVTRIEDRFGNSLTYSYDSSGHLTAITASDGRKLTVQYVTDTNRVQSVTLQPSAGAPRTWTYGYTTASSNWMELHTVTNPDGTQWTFDLGAFSDDAWLTSSTSGTCSTPATPDYIDSTWVGTITHPSGLTGTFTIKPMEHGRSYVPKTCWGSPYPDDPEKGYAFIPKAWYSFTLTQRTVSGADVPTKTWTYAYSSPNSSWDDDTCAANNSCASTVWTDVTDPGGHDTRHTFSNRFDVTEGELLSTTVYSGAAGTSVLRTQTQSYADPISGPWPSNYGDPLQARFNSAKVTEQSPLQQRVLTQDGDTYTWLAEAYDAYAQVTKTKRYNSISGQSPIEEQTSYYNDTALWVLGLPLQTDNLTTGETVSRNVYDTSNDTLQSRYRFGQKVMDYTFNAAGQLASFTDANGHTTTLANYKRGIPQQITYPDNTTQNPSVQTLSVDDFGQISSITDQGGHTTSYQYDAAGRVTKVTYPSGGAVAWAPKTFTYSYVTSAERGIAANHWRRTVSTGDAVQVTYFDALLQPILSESYDSTQSGSHTTAGTVYDWRGQPTFQSYPVAGSPSLTTVTGANGTHTTYDGLGRVRQVAQDSEQGTLTSTTAYLSGARKQVTDPNNNVTTTSYQVFDQPSYDAVTKVQAPEGITQTIARDIYGEPTSITQSGLYNGATDTVTKSLYYDSQHRLCRTSEPESGSTVVDYDAAGNIAWSAAGQTITGTDCGRTQVAAADETVRSYDAMNRVLSIAYPAGTEDTVYTYDALGNVLTAASGIATWTYSYNNRNALTDETLSVDGHSWGLHYAYDANGTVQSTTYPDGKLVSYAPDALGRPSKAGVYATGASYLPDGSLESFTLGNGVQYLAQKNARQLLSNLTYSNGSTLVYSQDMSYDPNANLTSTTDLVPSGTRSKSFVYDGLNRLTSAQANDLWGTETYSYDALNNIRSMDSDGLVRTYHYDAKNLLSSITTGSGTLHSYAYDPQGNTTTRDSDTLVFDKANRLQQVVGKDSYAYDASGRRVKKTPDGGTSTYYAYSNAGQLMWEYDAGTQQNTDYVYLGGKMVAKVVSDAGDPTLNAPGISFDANPNNGSYTVSWTGETGASYELQEQVGSGSWSQVYSGTAQSQAFSGKTGGTYHYRVRECDGDCGEWGVSAELDVVPSAPSSISVPATSNGPITISWSSSTSATSYVLQVQNNGSAWTQKYSGSALSYAYTMTSSGNHVFRVKACNAYGCSSYKQSSVVVVTLPPSSAPSLSAPSNNSTGSYTVSWGTVSGATSYTLQQQVNGGSWSTSYTGSGTSKAYSGKSNGTTYGYRVHACNAGGCGPWSGTKSVSVAIPPPVPTGLTVYLSGPSYKQVANVSWNAVSGASSYTVEEDMPDGTVNTTTGMTSTSYSKLMSQGGDYSVRVKSCNAYACSSWTAYKSVFVTSGF